MHEYISGLSEPDIQIGYIGSDGTIIELKEIEEIPAESIPVNAEYAHIAFRTPVSFTGILYNKRYAKGMFDYICGLNTLAAYRYIRWQKRLEEKARREKLKYGR